MRTTPISPQPIDRTGRWLASLTQWVLAHKRLVAVGWLVLTLVGFYGAAKAAMQAIRIKKASCLLRSRSASVARTIAGAGAVSTA